MSQQAIRTEVTATDDELAALFGPTFMAFVSGTIPCSEGIWKQERTNDWRFYHFQDN